MPTRTSGGNVAQAAHPPRKHPESRERSGDHDGPGDGEELPDVLAQKYPAELMKRLQGLYSRLE